MIIFGVVITLLAVLVRFRVRGFCSADMEGYLLPWYDQIKAGGGLSMLKQQVGDYNILFQVGIALMTYIKNVNPIFLYKGFSILFDFLLAALAGLMAYELDEKKKPARSVIVYAVVLFFPTVLLNSSFWGQSDSVYTFFVILRFICYCGVKTRRRLLCSE